MVVQLPIQSHFGKTRFAHDDENNHITIPGFFFYDNVEELFLRKELKWQKPL
jgi:hypothetical protein